MTPHPVDKHIGKRIRMRRMVLGISQTELGRAIGVTFQQVQKYEQAVNRIGGSRLFEISKVLQAPVSYFFEAMEGQPDAGFAEEDEVFKVGLERERETAALIRAYYRITDPEIRKRTLSLIRSLQSEELAKSTKK